MKHIQTWLLITLLALSASGVANAKLASGHQNLSGNLDQSQTVLNVLLHQGLEQVSTTDTSGSPLAAKGLGNLTKSQQKAVRGLQNQIKDHQKKLSDFKDNPDKFDNKGFLKNASPELRDKIINSRIKSLEGQIGTFRKDIDAIQSGAKKVLEKGG